jgi:hypothetical protein
MEGNDDTLARHRLRPSLGQPQEESDKPEVAAGNAFATLRGQRKAITLEFMPRQGLGFVLYYANLPHVWIKRPDILLLEYPSLFTVGIRCKGLDTLKDHISQQRLIWIRECSDAEAASLPTAATVIEIHHLYPSRDARTGNRLLL